MMMLGCNVSMVSFSAYCHYYIILSTQVQNAMRLMLDWSMVQQLMKVEWRYVRVGCGALCVITAGIQLMQKWFVNNWDMKDVSFVY